jgi:hypothetical protein
VEPAPIPSEPSKPLSNLESIGKYSGGVGVALYALGLLVANEYLVGLRLSDWELLKAQCFLTGLWTTVVIAVGLIPAAMLWFGAQKSDGVARRIAVVLITLGGGWVFSLLLSLPLLWLLDVQGITDNPDLLKLPFPHPPQPILEITLASFVILFLSRAGFSTREGTRWVSDKTVFCVAAAIHVNTRQLDSIEWNLRLRAKSIWWGPSRNCNAIAKQGRRAHVVNDVRLSMV